MFYGITCVIVGARKCTHMKENIGAFDWKIDNKDLDNIITILKERDAVIHSLNK